MAFQVSLDVPAKKKPALVTSGMFALQKAKPAIKVPGKALANMEAALPPPATQPPTEELEGHPMGTPAGGILCLSTDCIEQCVRCPLVLCHDVLEKLLGCIRTCLRIEKNPYQPLPSQEVEPRKAANPRSFRL